MDQYGQNNGVANNSVYNSSIPSIAPQQLQQSTANSLPSLNALQAQQSNHGLGPYSAIYGQPITAPQTPSTSAPNTPGSQGNATFQSQSLGGPQAPNRIYQPQSNPYQTQQQQQHQQQSQQVQQQHQQQQQQPMQSYNPSSIMAHPVSMSQHSQAVAPPSSHAPGNRNLAALRPLPPGMHGQMQNNMPNGYGQQHAHLPPENEAPIHVVGSQGRRGVLPSLPGRPPVTTSSKNTPIPAKDADGKFPCPHCTKSYLHAKHLKRHLLRHTGDRPYQCCLCNDTFSRSDILKRHFQKCSLRRGNPTGATHLTHAQAHLGKRHKSTPSQSTMPTLDQNPNGANFPFGIIPGSPVKQDDSPHSVSRPNSVKLENGTQNRRNMNGPTPPNGSTRNSFDEQAYGNAMPSTMTSSMSSALAFSMSNGQAQVFQPTYNFAPQNGSLPQQTNGDLSSLAGRSVLSMYSNGQQWGGGPNQNYFQPGAQDGFMTQFNPSLGQLQVQTRTAIKPDPSLTQTEQALAALYSQSDISRHVGASAATPSWTNTPDRMPQIVQRVSAFCFSPDGTLPQLCGLFLTADNFGHFLDKFSHFQGHFPILHIPTFQASETSEALLLAMICVGAVYSNRVTSNQVRAFMEAAKSAIEKDSAAYMAASRDPSGELLVSDGNKKEKRKELESLQALYMMQILFIFHGTPVQRERIRRKFPLVAKIAKSMGLTRPSADHELFSVLHQPNATAENVSSRDFDWTAWVLQETRSRLFYVIYLLDTAMVIYFNLAPHFDGNSVHLPLPADDAAWEANTATDCADALGLHGSTAAKGMNMEGSRRAKQPELHTALKSLLDSQQIHFDAGMTNLYSKFVLIHALQIQLWKILVAARTNTPVSQNSSPDGDNTQYSMEVLNSALSKWKHAWDIDMSKQYPPNSLHHRRQGFCRDGVHFYWLTRYLAQNRLDWNMAPDQRLSHIIAVLKHVKCWVVTDAAQRGEDLGSVSGINHEYGAADLTLDMEQFFKPLSDVDAKEGLPAML